MKKILLLPALVLFVAGCSNSEEQLVKKADRIHSSIITVDTHCDTPMSFTDPDLTLVLNMRMVVWIFLG
jgi:hypothetical protein